MILRPALLGAMVALAFGIGEMPGPARAQGQMPALVGKVSSEVECPMEGVVVSAKKAGSTITVSVISDEQGRYQFPASRLEPGQYSLKIRAVGYVLDGSGSAEVAIEKTSIA